MREAYLGVWMGTNVYFIQPKLNKKNNISLIKLH